MCAAVNFLKQHKVSMIYKRESNTFLLLICQQATPKTLLLHFLCLFELLIPHTNLLSFDHIGRFEFSNSI